MSMNDLSPKRTDKFRAYRARKKAAGLREVRMWVPDVNAPEFQQALDAQIERINTSEDEREVMIFCEAHAAEMWESLD
jgi:Protein  of unknown function (DUF3018)